MSRREEKRHAQSHVELWSELDSAAAGPMGWRRHKEDPLQTINCFVFQGIVLRVSSRVSVACTGGGSKAGEMPPRTAALEVFYHPVLGYCLIETCE